MVVDLVPSAGLKKDIKDKSFQSAATIHGISDTAPNGGLIGWVKKSSLNPLIQDRISKIGMGNITEPIIIPGGFLVGFGTRLGGGCTSGHGICGIGRLSTSSMIATGIFVAIGMLTVAVLQQFGIYL